jgi:hypothetical protein
MSVTGLAVQVSLWFKEEGRELREFQKALIAMAA